MILDIVFVVAFVAVTISGVYVRLWRPYRASERWQAEEEEEDASS